MNAHEHIWIANRELKDAAVQSGTVNVHLGAPALVAEGQWQCAFQLEGLGGDAVRHAAGVDAIQALMNALESIATAIRESGRTLSWVGGEPADHGFRRQVPAYLGSEFAAHVEQLVGREVDPRIAQIMSAPARRP